MRKTIMTIAAAAAIPAAAIATPKPAEARCMGLLGWRRYRRGHSRRRVSLAGVRLRLSTVRLRLRLSTVRLRLRLSSVRLRPLRLRAGVLRGLRAARLLCAPQMPGEFGIRPNLRLGLRLKSL